MLAFIIELAKYSAEVQDLDPMNVISTCCCIIDSKIVGGTDLTSAKIEVLEEIYKKVPPCLIAHLESTYLSVCTKITNRTRLNH